MAFGLTPAPSSIPGARKAAGYSAVGAALDAVGVRAEVAQRAVLLARGFLDLHGRRKRPLRAACLRALSGVELPCQAVDALHGLGDLPAAARLFLAGAFDLLRDGAHLLAALHDELGTARLLGGGRGDLLNRGGDTTDGVGDLFAALGLLDRGARDGAHHV